MYMCNSNEVPSHPDAGARFRAAIIYLKSTVNSQEYLAHEKAPTPRTLQWTYA